MREDKFVRVFQKLANSSGDAINSEVRVSAIHTFG
jgi:hypothetical protein